MMLQRTLAFLALPFLGAAFLAPSTPSISTKSTTTTTTITRTQASISDDIIFGKELGAKEATKAGVSAPLGFFDPLGFYKGKTIRQQKKLRESELKHGRIAMLAVVGIIVQEFFHPFLAGDAGTAVEQFNSIEESINDFWAGLLFTLSLFEFKSIALGWDPIEETFKNPKIAGIRDEYVTGDLQFDPLGFCPDDDDSFIRMRTRELNNGRMAMIAAIGIIGQEVATGVPVVTSLFGSSGN